MTSPILHLFKRIFKIVLWVIGGVTTLVVVVGLLIQLPSVQNKIIQKATAFVSDKTHTKVEIKRAGIAFPKSVFVNGLFLEDESHDTLLYAGEVKISLDLFGLINGNIRLHNIEMNNVTVRLARGEKDSPYNFNFLLFAFSEPTKTAEMPKPVKENKEFEIDEVTLSNVRFRVNDQYTGLYASVFLQKLNVEVNALNLAEKVYDIDDLDVGGLDAVLAVKNTGIKKEKEQAAGKLPVINVHRLRIKNSAFSYSDDTSGTILSTINSFLLTGAALDLDAQKFSLNTLELKQSSIHVNVKNVKQENDTTLKKENSWRIAAKKINLEKNNFSYNATDKPRLDNAFDAAHINYKNISLEAANLFYSDAKTGANIHHASAEDSTNITLKNFEGDFKMTSHSVSAKNVEIKTADSDIQLTSDIRFHSLKSLRDSIQNLLVNAEIKKSIIHLKDVLYFSPQLKNDFFSKTAMNYVRLSGTIKGQVKNLEGENIFIGTGEKTSLKTGFVISGLPHIKDAYFNIPHFELQTGKADVTALVGKEILPVNLNLPPDLAINGNFRGRMDDFESSVEAFSDYGAISVMAEIDQDENFNGKINARQFNLGKLMNDSLLLGTVSTDIKVNGKGLTKDSIRAEISASVPEINLNKYPYHNLNIAGRITGQQFDGKITLNDSNAVFDLTGLVNLSPGKEKYQVIFDLKHADLKNLNLNERDIQVSAKAFSDLKVTGSNTISGNAGITNVVWVENKNKYVIDPLLYASVNESVQNDLSLNSSLVYAKLNGICSPQTIAGEIKKCVNKSFLLFDLPDTTVTNNPQHFNFEIALHKHPVLSGGLIPQLSELDSFVIRGSFNSNTNTLTFNAGVKYVVYSGIDVSHAVFDVNANGKNFNYTLTCEDITTGQARLQNFTAEGKLAENKSFLKLSSFDDQQQKKLLITSAMTKENDTYKISFDPGEFYLAGQSWALPADNYLAIAGKNLSFHNLALKKPGEEISITSVNNRFNDDISITIKNFQLSNISRLIEKDTSLAEGNINGTVLLKRINQSYGLVADVTIADLKVREIKTGNFSLKAENTDQNKFNIDARLTGEGNEIAVTGYYRTDSVNKALNIEASVNSLSMKTIEAFSMGQITESSGTVEGKLLVQGNLKTPEITGSLRFINAAMRPVATGNKISLQNETIEIKKDEIHFDHFTVRDAGNQAAVLNGSIETTSFSDIYFNLHLTAKNFTLFNTTEKDNENFFGIMIIDTRIDLKGTPALPEISSDIRFKKGSYLTFVTPKKQLTAGRGENVFVLVDSLNLDLSSLEKEEEAKLQNEFKGIEITSNIEVDNGVILKFLIDPVSNDSLVVNGNAALSFSMNRNGKMSLTGTYTLTGGSYNAALQAVFTRKKFDIEAGSTITWSGNPFDAELNINAIYNVRTNPADLVADQVSEGTVDPGSYHERVPFLVYLKLRKALLKPEISFEIQLPSEQKGVLGGTVNARLMQLNEDPSELNKQVFALLVLGHFVNQNTIEAQGGGGGMSDMARASVSSFLSAQLSRYTSKVPWFELNVDVQSYNDYASGTVEGKTEVGLELRKELFNNRVSVEIGGNVNVSPEKTHQNTASEITGDVTVKYKLTDDGRIRLKAFCDNQYEDIEGELSQAGVGILYTRDFDRWKEIFKPPAKSIPDDKKEKVP